MFSGGFTKTITFFKLLMFSGGFTKTITFLNNLAKGGSIIPDVIKTFEDFNADPANTTFRVDQVFVSVGTNDIR